MKTAALLMSYSSFCQESYSHSLESVENGCVFLKPYASSLVWVKKKIQKTVVKQKAILNSWEVHKIVACVEILSRATFLEPR